MIIIDVIITICSSGSNIIICYYKSKVQSDHTNM